MGHATYQKVFDDRKRRIRGLWKRNDHFYARLVIVDEATGHKSTKRVRLERPAPWLRPATPSKNHHGPQLHNG